MKAHFRPIFLLMLTALLLFFSSCELNQKDIKPADEFVKIYNHPDEGLSFYPVGVAEIEGSGFLFLSGVKADTADIEFPTTHIVRTNTTGEVEWTAEYSWLAPAGIFDFSGTTGFVAMDAQLNAYAVQIDLTDGSVQSQHHLEIDMPLKSMVDAQNNLVVLGYDYVSRSSWIALFASGFNIQSTRKLLIETDLEDQVQRHLNKTGQQFPFFIGEWADGSQHGYYVNCFNNYTLRTVFLDGGLSTRGNIYSFQTEAALSSLTQRSGNSYALTRYYAGNNYFLGEVEVDISTSQNFNDFQGTVLNELTVNARILSDRFEVGGSEYLLVSSQTNSNSIITYQHAAETDSLLATHTHPFNERVEIADMVQTADGGIAILAQIYILGKFQRPVLIKNPSELYKR